MNRTARLLAAVSLVGAMAACFDGINANLFGSPTQVTSGNQNEPTPTPTPTPTPSPSPSPTPCDPQKLPAPAAGECSISYIELRPLELTIPDKGEGRLSMTPFQTRLDCSGRVVQVEVSDSCNRPKAAQILWLSSSPSIRVGTGFEPLVTRAGTGVATVTATLDGVVSNQAIIR